MALVVVLLEAVVLLFLLLRWDLVVLMEEVVLDWGLEGVVQIELLLLWLLLEAT